MTYPPQPGGYPQQPDPYGQQPQQGGPYQQPVTGAPSSPAGGYGQPAYGQQPGFGGAPQAPGERPQKVTIAAFVTMGMAVLVLISAIVGIVGANQIYDNVTQMSGVTVEASAMDNITPITNFLWAAGFTAIALLLLRGINGGRIAAFVVHGLNIACGALGLLALSILSATLAPLANQGYDVSQIIPGWYFPVVIILGILQLVLPIVAIIMLASKEAGAWFAANSAARAAGIVR